MVRQGNRKRTGGKPPVRERVHLRSASRPQLLRKRLIGERCYVFAIWRPFCSSILLGRAAHLIFQDM
jgi:hypothetical protein